MSSLGPSSVWATLWFMFLFLGGTLLCAQDLITEAQDNTPSATDSQVPVTSEAELKTSGKPTSTSLSPTTRLLNAATSTSFLTAAFPSSTSSNGGSTVTAQGTTGALGTSDLATTSLVSESTVAGLLHSPEESFETTSVVPASTTHNSSEAVAMTLAPVATGTLPLASLPSSPSSTIGSTSEADATEVTVVTEFSTESSTESTTETSTESGIDPSVESSTDPSTERSTDPSTEPATTSLNPLDSRRLLFSVRPLPPQNSPNPLSSTIPPVFIEDMAQLSLQWIVIVAVLACVACVGGVFFLAMCVRRRRRSQGMHFGSGQRSGKKKKKGEADAWAGQVNLEEAGREEREGGEESAGGGVGDKPADGAEDMLLSTFVAKETVREGPDGGVGEAGSKEGSKWEEEAPLLYIDEEALPEPASAGEEGEKASGEEAGEKASGKETGEKASGKENGRVTVGEINGGATFCMTTAI